MVAYHVVVLFAIFTTCSAGCTGGKIDGPNSRAIFHATRHLYHFGTKPVICSYNHCKHMDVTLNRVDISGNGWSCKSGGPGDYKVEIYLNGGDSRNFIATVWATGKDRDVVRDPTNEFTWGCILQELYIEGC